jgi:Skp family chaperone for outer membrane proteins
VAIFWLLDDSIQPEWAKKFEARINNKLGKIMALVQVEQGDLDALDQALDDATKALSDKIQALIDAGKLPAADVSALQADVENLRALAAPAPVVEPPVA